jgi:hypothetical protein
MLSQTLKRTGFTVAMVLAGMATASAFPGAGGGGGFGGGGIGGAGMSGVPVGSIGSISGAGVPGMGGPNALGPTFTMPQRFRDLNVVGQVGIDPSRQPPNATIVQLRLDGQEIPMRLDTETQGAELEFNPNDAYARDLYRSITTKRVEVVGEQDLRNEIAQAAGQSKPLQIEGYVFDQTSPYFVIKSVKPQ